MLPCRLTCHKSTYLARVYLLLYAVIKTSDLKDSLDNQNTENDNFVAILPRVGIEYTYLDIYYFRAGIGNGRIAFGWGMEYDLFNNNDSKIDYTFSMDWASQISHTLSYGFNF